TEGGEYRGHRRPPRAGARAAPVARSDRGSGRGPRRRGGRRIDADAERLWREALERLAGRAAHEIRNPLNGLTVSVEVLRSRLTRGGVAPQSLQPFAESAAEELRRVTPLLDALLSLARQPRTPVDLWTAVQPVLQLQAAVAAAH